MAIARRQLGLGVECILIALCKKWLKRIGAQGGRRGSARLHFNQGPLMMVKVVVVVIARLDSVPGAY